MSFPEGKECYLKLSEECQKSENMETTWKIHLEYVYRMDREERLKQAYGLVVPDTNFNLREDQKQEVSNEQPKNGSVCESVEQTAKSGTYD
jgi:hypothetical protein